MLNESGALGRFPTPVADIMAAAKVTVVQENVLDTGFLARMRKKASSALKRALSKVLGLLDVGGQLVFIDRGVLLVKQTFLKLHEAGHTVMPWQRDIYAVVEDCEKTLAPEIADQFDREANVFASEVLFQLDQFTREASKFEFGIKTPLLLSKKYGASIYASVRRYVSKNPRACVVLVLNLPELAEGDGFRSSLRRVVASPLFLETVGDLEWPNLFRPDDEIGTLIPLGGRKMSSPREIALRDRNGQLHECIAEAFTQRHQIFILIHAVRTLTKKTIILPVSI
jgi:hypothetical protein